MTILDSKLIKYLKQDNIVDASSPEYGGSYVANNPLVSDNTEVLAYNLNNITIKDQKIRIVRPSDEFIAKVDNAWKLFQSTKKGTYAFNGPIVAVDKYKITKNKIINNQNPKFNLELGMKLITYADLAMSYHPQFSAEEKNDNYSFGVSSILLTADDKYIFGIRSNNVAATGGSITNIRGFLGLKDLIDPTLEAQIKAYCKEGTFWNKVGNELPTEIDINLDLHKTFNLEKHEEVGTIPTDLMTVENKAFTKFVLYQNYTLVDLVHLSIDEETVRKRFKDADKEITQLMFVPKKNLPEFVMKNRSEIDTGLRSILQIELLYK